VNVLVTPPQEEPITLAMAKLRAGLDWAAGDPRDDLMQQFIAAARVRVEHDTGRALIAQVRSITFDLLQPVPVIQLPDQAHPLQELTAIVTTDYFGNTTTLDPALYQVDLEAGRIYFSWPAVTVFWNLQPFQGWQVQVIAGRKDAADLLARDPGLVQLVGLMAAHMATLGRDVVLEDRRVTQTPQGYEELLAAYVPIAVV
jgi:uncharacterized phiE125 gp8 family phage protein